MQRSHADALAAAQERDSGANAGSAGVVDEAAGELAATKRSLANAVKVRANQKV